MSTSTGSRLRQRAQLYSSMIFGSNEDDSADDMSDYGNVLSMVRQKSAS